MLVESNRLKIVASFTRTELQSKAEATYTIQCSDTMKVLHFVFFIQTH